MALSEFLTDINEKAHRFNFELCCVNDVWFREIKHQILLGRSLPLAEWRTHEFERGGLVIWGQANLPLRKRVSGAEPPEAEQFLLT